MRRAAGKKTYEEEQAALQQEADGASNPEDISISAPKEPEVNPEVYRDVIPLLTKGFLYVPVTIGDVLFVFKSLNQHEFELVRLLSGATDTVVPRRFWDLFLSYMVLFVDGQNILLDRERQISKLADTFRDLPQGARQKLIRQLSDLNRRVSNATTLVEAYAMEGYSRWRWAQVQGLDLMSPTLTGISGTERLGLSWAQLIWRAFNYFEDIRHTQDVEWENAKFVGGCMAGKGIQKIYNQDADRRQKDKQERWNRKDQLIRHIHFGDPLEADKKYGGAQVIQVASTVEELADQVQRSLRGEKDWHDEMIEAHEKQIRDRFQAQRDQLEELVASRDAEMGPFNVTGSSSIEGLTPAQVAERILRQKQLEAQSLASRIVYPEMHDEKLGGVLDKLGFSQKTPTTERSPDDAIPLQPRRNVGTPWRR
jgi:hypothetical protein